MDKVKDMRKLINESKRGIFIKEEVEIKNTSGIEEDKLRQMIDDAFDEISWNMSHDPRWDDVEDNPTDEQAAEWDKDFNDKLKVKYPELKNIDMNFYAWWNQFNPN